VVEGGGEAEAEGAEGSHESMAVQYQSHEMRSAHITKSKLKVLPALTLYVLLIALSQQLWYSCMNACYTARPSTAKHNTGKHSTESHKAIQLPFVGKPEEEGDLLPKRGSGAVPESEGGLGQQLARNYIQGKCVLLDHVSSRTC
jgi:hypothetical protein